MKTTTILASASFLITAVLALVAARANAADGSGVWEGNGTAYGADGVAVGHFAVTFTRRQEGNRARIEGKATLASGKEISFWEEDVNEGSTGFQITSSEGTGHGGCFGNGICQTYKRDAAGHAVSTTFVIDSADEARVQQTEYQNDQVVQYREETVKRK
jgi:hypothetical protein